MPTFPGRARSSVRQRMRVHRAPKVLPATTQAPIFNVVGGSVRITGLVGRVTTATDATATTLKVTGNPAIGADVDLSAATAVASLPVGRIVGLSGALGTALAAVQAFAGVSSGYIVPAGTIDLVTSATNLGQIEWTIEYEPVDANARVTIA